jgi:hypothetical protein
MQEALQAEEQRQGASSLPPPLRKLQHPHWRSLLERRSLPDQPGPC